jgi:hypothetical protein
MDGGAVKNAHCFGRCSAALQERAAQSRVISAFVRIKRSKAAARLAKDE